MIFKRNEAVNYKQGDPDDVGRDPDVSGQQQYGLVVTITRVSVTNSRDVQRAHGLGFRLTAKHTITFTS